MEEKEHIIKVAQFPEETFDTILERAINEAVLFASSLGKEEINLTFIGVKLTNKRYEFNEYIFKATPVEENN